VEVTMCAVTRVTRELPPLKRIRSMKKIADPSSNLATNDNILNLQNASQLASKGEDKAPAPLIEVVEIHEENEKTTYRTNNAFRETRTKKLRLSKQVENIPGAYF